MVIMPISALILCGGRAKRMHGVNKGLVKLNEQTFIQHVISRLAPQVDEIIINANREMSMYESLGYDVYQDVSPDFIGPLAGIQLGLSHAKYDYLLTAPCDSPLLPLDLGQRLMAKLFENHADIAVATSRGDAHPVFCLCKKSVLPSLTEYITNGGRKVSAWQKSLQYIEVDFSDNAEAFLNLNTPEELASLELKLSSYVK